MRFKNPYTSLIKRTWQYAGKEKRRIVLIYCLFICSNLVIMSEPYILGKLLNVLQSGGNDLFWNALPFLIAYGALSLFFWMFHGPARVIERLASFRLTANFQNRLFQITTLLPMKWHKHHHSGETINKINKASVALKTYSEDSYTYLETVVKFVVSLTAILILLPLFGLLTLIGAIVVAIVIFRFDAFLIPLLHRINDGEHRVAAAIFDYISNIGTVITLRLEKLSQKEVVKKIMSFLPIFRQNVIYNEVKWFIISMLLAILQFVILGTYLFDRTGSGQVFLIGNFVMLYEYLGKFMNVFFDLAYKYENLVRHNTNVESADSLFSAFDLLVKKQSVLEPPIKWNEIEIKNLSFRYEDEAHRSHHLKNIHLILQRGQKIALVGASGGGKSTLMGLIRGLHETESGTVRINGKRYNCLRILRDMTTLLPQDPEIFENTIEYNITAGISHRREEIMEACRLAVFEPVLQRLPQGLKTHINEKGVNLSGGEKQRLALARGIFAARESSLILLDEPTSSVDTMNERKIYENLFSHFREKCLVSSIHRLHLLPLFDFIYVLKDGMIVEEGSFAELMAKESELKKMYENYQKEKFDRI